MFLTKSCSSSEFRNLPQAREDLCFDIILIALSILPLPPRISKKKKKKALRKESLSVEAAGNLTEMM